MNKKLLFLILFLCDGHVMAQNPAVTAVLGTSATVGTAVLVTKLSNPVAIRSFSSPGSLIGASEKKGDPLYTFSRFALYGAVAADLGTTEYVIAHGGTETNPLLGNSRARRIGLSAFLAVVGDYGTHLAYKHGQVKLAKTLNFIVVGSRSAAAIQNVMVAR